MDVPQGSVTFTGQLKQGKEYLMVSRKKTLELKKHVATIHSSNKLSLLQRKIANALLFNAYDELLVKEEYEIHIATLCKLIGYDSNDYKTIKKALVNLLATVIEWNLVDGDKLNAEGVWNASSIIADASIDGPLCTYSYSNKMKKLLYRPELYGRLNMLVLAQFKSSYGLALYENCVRYQNINQTPWFDIAKFRKLMGVEDGKYKIFRDFKTRVLDKAVEEVNQYSSITVTPQFQKQKRQVVAIQFLIRAAKDTPVSESQQTETYSTLSEILKLKFGLSKKQIEEVMTNYDDDYIRQKITLVESSASFAQGKISNLAKYLISALNDDYQPTKSSQASQLIKRSTSVERNLQLKFDQSRGEEYRRFQQKEIISLLNKKRKTEQKEILSEFEKKLGKGIYRDIYLRDGMSNVLIQDQFCQFVRQMRQDFLDLIPTYAQFCELFSETEL
jgi:plasmid replication initiation protein